MNNLRVIGMSNNHYLVADYNDKGVNGNYKYAYLADKIGRMITKRLPIHVFVEDDFEWEPMDESYEDIFSKRTINQLVKDALLGFAIGDAFGVPYEFLSRSVIENLELKDMLGNDTKEKINSRWGTLIPAGAWSDDTSMIVATMVAFIKSNNCFIPENVMNEFINWWYSRKYISIDAPFGLGGVVSKALENFRNGVPATECGPSEFKDNGNGCLMRILPYSLYCIVNDLSFEETCKIISEGSSLTHGNDISKICCCIYTEFLRNCVKTRNPIMSFDMLCDLDFKGLFNKEAVDIVRTLLKPRFKYAKKGDIPEKNGYVVYTLESVFYSLINSNDYESSIKMAVSMGYDTDTVAGITGAASAIIYGLTNVPKNWEETLKKKNDLETLANSFSNGIKKNDIAIYTKA